MASILNVRSSWVPVGNMHTEINKGCGSSGLVTSSSKEAKGGRGEDHQQRKGLSGRTGRSHWKRYTASVLNPAGRSRRLTSGTLLCPACPPPPLCHRDLSPLWEVGSHGNPKGQRRNQRQERTRPRPHSWGRTLEFLPSVLCRPSARTVL